MRGCDYIGVEIMPEGELLEKFDEFKNPTKPPDMKTEAQLLSQVDTFNKTHPVGHLVEVKRDNGEIDICTVEKPASILGGHSAVGWFKEISGCYSLGRVL